MLISKISKIFTILLICTFTLQVNAQNPQQQPKMKSTLTETAAKKTVKKIIIKQPTSHQFMFTPSSHDFIKIANDDYFLSVPKKFGNNPLADYPQIQGPMLVFTASNTLAMAINIIDPLDTIHYKPQVHLPDFTNKQKLCSWEHPTAAKLNCTLSRHTDYSGDKLLLQANSFQNGKTYELLYVFPFDQYDILLPQVLYSLNSFSYLL